MTVPILTAGLLRPAVRFAIGVLLVSAAGLATLTAPAPAAGDGQPSENTPEWQVSDTSINDGWEVPGELLDAAADPADVGRWAPVADWPLMAIHAAMAADGDILTYGTDTDGIQTGRFVYDVWTPGQSAADGHATLTNTTSTDLFCSLQLNRSDGDGMLLFGGDNWTGSRTTNTGNDDINLYDPGTDTITAIPGMNRPRWYATGTTLPDGSMYIQGGLGGEDRPERWSADTGAQLLAFSTAQLNYNYPRNFLLTDGRIFGFDINGRMYVVSADLTSLTRLGNLPMPSFGNSTTAAMFQPDRILFFGSNTSQAWIIDLTEGTPRVTATGATADDNRTWVNATVLPDGRVLATGGAAVSSVERQTGPLDEYDVNTSAEVWDPATGEWTTLALAAKARLYHSTAILLQDGRVLTAGGGAPGPVTNLDAEIFSPDYLWADDGSEADRPAIATLSTAAAEPGTELSLTVTPNSSVERLTMVKTGSVTHSFDMEQRFVELEFSRLDDTVTTTLPTDGSLASPGIYHLWVLDGDGTPSASRLIRVLPSGGSNITSIGGSIMFADRRPAQGAKVDLFVADGPGRRGRFLGYAQADAEGRYRFEVPAGCYILTFIAPEGESYEGTPWFQPGQCLEPNQVVADLDAVLDP